MATEHGTATLIDGTIYSIERRREGKNIIRYSQIKQIKPVSVLQFTHGVRQGSINVN